MNETLVTVVGNVATRPDFRQTAAGVALARFRLAVTARRWDRGRESWTDAHTSFYTVWAWRTLAANVAASVSVGEPLLVRGRLRVREGYRDGASDRQVPLTQPWADPMRDSGTASPPGMVDRARGAAPEPRQDGGRWLSVDIEAVALGHDLTWGTSAFRRVQPAKPLPTGATPA